jgi:hypothetical protein
MPSTAVPEPFPTMPSLKAMDFLKDQKTAQYHSSLERRHSSKSQLAEKEESFRFSFRKAIK